jgi:hypothetical protein
MKNNPQWTYKMTMVLCFLVFLALACNAPGLGDQAISEVVEALDPVAETANALADQVSATQAALDVDDVQDTIDNAADLVEDVLPDSVPPPSDQPAPNVPPGTLPDQPGPPEETIEDVNASLTAGDKNVTEGDAYQGNLYERPFSAQMDYIPELDILRAEISNDGNFFYVSIFLNGNAAGMPGIFVVELDTDKDGRGDYLVVATSPVSGEWSANNMTIRMDPNADVGGQQPLKEDDAGGNGYESLILTSEQANELGTAWSRISPNDPKNIQIAFKSDFMDNREKFLWGVWADNGFKNPEMFDYNDHFTIGEAGSPMKDHENYPLKELHSVDNTCRTVYGIPHTGLEPGVCGSEENIPADPGSAAAATVPPNIPAVTPPVVIPELPSLP